MWIKLHDTLPDHPKVIAAAAALSIDKDVLVGKLTRLWLWAATGRENGYIADSEASTVAEVMRWKKSPQKLLDALCIIPVRYTSGLLDRVDGGYCIHDWEEQVSEMIDRRDAKKEQTRLRVQRYRERKAEKDETRNGALQGNAPVTQCNAPRVDKSRVDKSNVVTRYTPCDPPPGADAPDTDTDPPKAPSPADRRFEEFWTAYPRKVGKLAARKVWDKIKVTEELHTRMLAAVEKAKHGDQWTRDGGQYIPNPATWLSQGRWDDEIPVTQPHAVPAGRPIAPSTPSKSQRFLDRAKELERLETG